MRETIKSLLGSLPVEYFTMSISSVTENLAQLMFSMMMTGYMFRNAQYRLELQKSVLSTRASLKGAVPRGSVELSEGTPDAVEYVSELESEIEALRAEVSVSHGHQTTHINGKMSCSTILKAWSLKIFVT